MIAIKLLVPVAMIGWLAFFWLKCLRNGSIFMQGHEWRRTHEPGSFWFEMIVVGMITSGILVMTVLMLRELMMDSGAMAWVSCIGSVCF